MARVHSQWVPNRDNGRSHAARLSLVDKGLGMISKKPVCVKCGTKLKGRVPMDAVVTCFFCANPRGEQDDDDNKILKSKDVSNARS